MLTFLALKNIMWSKLGLTLPILPGEEADKIATIELALNMIQEECNKDPALRNMLLKKGRILTTAEVTTGRVSVTRGSRAITFDTAILNSDFKDRLFICGGMEYRLIAITSDTVARLDAPYAHDTNPTATFRIIKDRYYLGREVIGVWNAFDRTNDRELELRSFTELSGEGADIGNPDDGALILSTEPFYSVGTLTIASGATSGTIAGGTLVSEFDGLALRIANDMVDYDLGFVSATAFTIDRPYEGVSRAGVTYQIAPAGQWMIELYERPTTSILIEYDYLYRLKRLVGDNEISLITTLDDNVLWRGAIWAIKDDEGVDPQGIATAFQLYQNAKAQMALAAGELLPAISETKYRDL